MTSKLVRDLMQIGVTTCPDETRLEEAVRILLRTNLETLIVLDETGHAVGLFGRREAVSAYARAGADLEACRQLTVAELVRPEIPEIPPDLPASAAAQMMLDWNVRDLFLMHHDGGIRWPAAVLRFDDLLCYVASGSDPGAAGLETHFTRRRWSSRDAT